MFLLEPFYPWLAFCCLICVAGVVNVSAEINK